MAAEGCRQLAVAACLAGGNLLQRLPDALLKGCAAQVERQLGGALRFFQLADDCLQPVAQPGLIAVQVGGGEARAQLLFQRGFVIAEQQGTDALVAGRKQQQAERTGRQGIAQGFAGALATPLCRGQRPCLGIGRTGAGVTDGKGGIQYRTGLGQLGIEAFTARAVRTMSAAGSFHRYRRG